MQFMGKIDYFSAKSLLDDLLLSPYSLTLEFNTEQSTIISCHYHLHGVNKINPKLNKIGYICLTSLKQEEPSVIQTASTDKPTENGNAMEVDSEEGQTSSSKISRKFV